MVAEVNAMDKLRDEVVQIQQKVEEINVAVENDLPTEEGMHYLQVKNHALLTYTKMELFFTLLKLEAPERVHNHPVFKELVRYRTLLERIRPLDRKLKYQIDKMLKVAVSGGNDMDASLNYAPNPELLVGQDGQAIGGDDDEDDDDANSTGTRRRGSKDKDATDDGVYRAPRLASVPYDEDEKEAAKKAKRDERNRKRMQKSTILSELREEFSERPAEILASGSSAVDKEIAADEAAQKDFEESRFVRLVTSRKDKIRKRQREAEANRADHVGSIDNFAGVQDILSLDKTTHRIPIAKPSTTKIGGKTGGIFAHIEAPTEKKRKVPRSGGASAFASSSNSSARTATASSNNGGGGKDANTVAGGAKKKKKVVYSNLFS